MNFCSFCYKLVWKMKSEYSVWNFSQHCEGETDAWWSERSLYSSLGEQFSIPQVPSPQEVFSLSLIKSHSNKLLTLIPLEFHIEDSSLRSHPALEYYHFNRINRLKPKNEAREWEGLVDRRSELRCPQGILWILLKFIQGLSILVCGQRRDQGQQTVIFTISTHSPIFLLKGNRASMGTVAALLLLSCSNLQDDLLSFSWAQVSVASWSVLDLQGPQDCLGT